MKEVQIERIKLHDIVQKNRTQHILDYQEARKEWQVQATTAIRDALTAAQAGSFPACVGRSYPVVALPEKPVSHMMDYERVLGMLVHETREQVVLTEQEFSQYVMDDWDWKEDFLRVSNTYRATARENLR